MKPIEQQTHYEILEIPRDADEAGVQRAYRLARATYGDDSLALYSLFGEGDARVIRERVEEAYRVLSDPDARRAYDVALGAAGHDAAAGVPAASRPPPRADRARPGFDEAPRESALDDGFDEIDSLDHDETAEPDGACLRRARLRRGLELAQIAATTKIKSSYLRSIEDEAFDDLPARVYVRGFVASFAREVGLEPNEVARAYMARYAAFIEESQSPRRGKRAPRAAASERVQRAESPEPSRRRLFRRR